VCATEKLDVRDRGLTTDSVRLVVVKLDEASLVAPPAVFAPEGASTVVTRTDHAPNLRRDGTTSLTIIASQNRPVLKWAQ